MTELTAGIGDNSTALDNVDRLAELAHEIKARSDRIEQRTRKTAEEMIEAGKLLLEAKELVKHGQFMKWIETNLNIPYSSAASWMTLAKHNRGDKLAQWLVDDLKKAPFARELMNPSEIIATFGPEEYGDDEDEDDLEPTQTGAEIQAGVFPPTEAPPQTKRTETKVEVKTPETVKTLPLGKPARIPTAPLEKGKLPSKLKDHTPTFGPYNEDLCRKIKITKGLFYVEKSVDDCLSEMTQLITGMLDNGVDIETILNAVRDALGEDRSA